jgi:hypothetical protein
MKTKDWKEPLIGNEFQQNMDAGLKMKNQLGIMSLVESWPINWVKLPSSKLLVKQNTKKLNYKTIFEVWKHCKLEKERKIVKSNS